jgi:hypothetical protein
MISTNRMNHAWTLITGIASIVVLGALFMLIKADISSVKRVPTDQGPRKVHVASYDDFLLDYYKVTLWDDYK